jgi:16S rRNA (uracil1498-N3)-methyltransferase
VDWGLLIVDGRLDRFYAAAIEGEFAELSAEEAHHLTHVLRLGEGDEIAVFDGRGAEWRARVERAGRRGAQVRLLDRLEPPAEPRVALTLAQAILKGDKMDAVVRDATMLGVAAVQPLLTRRTVVRAAAARSDAARERWRRVAIASAKQCRRAVVPELLPVEVFEDWVKVVTNGIILVEPGAPGVGEDRSLARGYGQSGAVQTATLIIGPEGGWESAEIEGALRAGGKALTLGELTLRAETAPIVAIAALRTAWGDFSRPFSARL